MIGHDQPERRPVLSSRCPLFKGKCDDGVLIGMCPNRPRCAQLRQWEDEGKDFWIEFEKREKF